MGQHLDENLLEETLRVLASVGKTPEDIAWVGGEHWGWFTWEEFVSIANIDYYSSYGHPEIATDLKVVGFGWWLERREYDGAEWWEYITIPTKPKEHKVPKRLCDRQLPEEQAIWASVTLNGLNIEKEEEENDSN